MIIAEINNARMDGIEHHCEAKEMKSKLAELYAQACRKVLVFDSKHSYIMPELGYAQVSDGITITEFRVLKSA